MKPIVQALLVADHVYVDKQTNKKVVAGIFHHLWFKKTAHEVKPGAEPGQVKINVPPGGFSAGSPFCYISLTDVRGHLPMELRYVNLADEKPLFGLQFGVDCQDPLQTVELVLPLPPLALTKAGTFAMELLWNGETLGVYRITVGEIKDEPPKQPDSPPMTN